jgi:1-acyl-sn-glycerol-3-phosphate acyltransferase
LRWILDRVYATARRTFRLRVVGSGPGEPLPRDRPLLVLCRHAGPGDSVLLIRALVTLAERRPRIVLKDALQLDPTVDILLNRLPNRFITPRPGVAEDVEAAIASLAAGAGPGDAVVIFPEGGNFSEGRRSRAIERLRSLGHADEAAKAERMRHLMAPKPGGTLAALAAAPDADVLLVAHEGLEDLSTLGDLWTKLPMDDVVDVRWWHVPSAELPRDRDVDAQVDWLFDWWTRMDTWVAARRPTPD